MGEGDEELLDRYLRGEARAFDQLVDRHGAAVYSFVRRFLGASPAVDDLTQEVWLRVLRHARGFERQSRFSTWLFAVTRNTCIDFLRRQGTRDGIEDGAEAPPDPPDPGIPVLESLAQRELVARVGRAVGDLPVALREVFLLREQTDLTFADIAHLLGVPRDTVKSRMRYALARIRRAVRRAPGQEAVHEL